GCRRRSPSRARQASARARLPSLTVPEFRRSQARSFVPVLVLLVLFLFVLLVVVLPHLFVFFEIFVLFVVFVRGEVEFERSKPGHLERAAALRATELVALVDVKFVHLDLGVAFGTGRNRIPRACTRERRSVWQMGG